MLGTLQHVFEIVDKVGEDATSGACLGELVSLPAAEIQKAELIALGVVAKVEEILMLLIRDTHSSEPTH